MKYFVTAIGTDSGKTVISAILSLALKCDYWKPVQAGFPTDTGTIQHLTNGLVTCHRERHILETPASPHAAAAIDNIRIDLNDFVLPNTENLIVEGAGGLMVPLNERDLVIDIAVKFEIPIILVSNNYLGSINHTLLSLEYLKQKDIPIAGIIFNGPSNAATEEIILSKTAAPCLLKLLQFKSLDFQTVHRLAEELKPKVYDLVR